MLAFLLLVADQAPAAPEGGGGSIFANPIIPLMLMLVAAYFLFIMPARRQEKDRQAQIANLKKNDKVVAAGGIIGTVAAINEKENEVTIKVDDNVRLRVVRDCIQRVVNTDEAAKQTKEGTA